MGCLNSTPGDGEKSEIRRTTIKINEGRKGQGVHELKKNYHIDTKTRVLGTGAFGRVFHTHNRYDNNFQVAIKVLDKQKLRENIDCIMEEVAILNKLDHPNIVKYFETYDDSKYIYLVMEYIKGSQLFEMITKQENQTFNERQAGIYMKSLFQAINHCHAQGIIHRDIKPENIMITDTGSVRLIDFGLSKASKKNLKTIAGTPYYMAPEVLEGNYGTKADIWSLGVLLYTLVSGYLPFQGTSSADVFRKIKEADYHFNHPEFATVSQECKDLIKHLLVINEKKRLTGHQALQHAWFVKLGLDKSQSGNCKSDLKVAINDDVIKRLQAFRGVSHFKRAAMNLLIKTASEEEVRELRDQFMEIDKDGTGLIKVSELRDLLKSKQINMTDDEIKKLVQEMDYQQNGMINYSEFLSATINVKTFLNDQRLLAVFNQFDTDNSNKITEENIYLAMQKLGQEISKDEIHEMMLKHDQTKDGMLSFEEFKSIFINKDTI